MRRLILIAVLVIIAIFANAQAPAGAPASVVSPGRSVGVVHARPAAVPPATFGPPASVLSPAPGRQFGPPPSVTSLGPTGYTFAPCVLGDCGRFRHRFGNFGFQGFVAAYPVVIPIFATPEIPVVPVDESGNLADASTQDNEIVGTQGGGSSIMYSSQRHVTMAHPNGAPVVGTQPSDDEERPRNARSADTRDEDSREVASRKVDAPPPSPPAPQETTVLVFKDGRKLQVTNYAIQGDTLFNFSDQGPRRVAVSDLDVKATIKTNEDHGVQFRLP